MIGIKMESYWGVGDESELIGHVWCNLYLIGSNEKYRDLTGIHGGPNILFHNLSHQNIGVIPRE